MALQRVALAGPTAPINIKLHMTRYNRITLWDIAHLKAPFWRCYIPFEKGGEVVFCRKTYTLNPGYGMLIPPDTVCRSHAAETFRKVFCHFSCDILVKTGVYEFTLPEGILPQVEKMLENLPRDNKVGLYEEIKVNCLMINLLAEGILRMPKEAFLENPQLSQQIRVVIEVMRNNLDNVLSNKKLAEGIDMHENSFIRLFTGQMKIAPQKYYARLRLEQAALFLTTTDKSIETIARECGFWDRNHFTRSFSQEWKCPPATFRKLGKT